MKAETDTVLSKTETHSQLYGKQESRCWQKPTHCLQNISSLRSHRLTAVRNRFSASENETFCCRTQRQTHRRQKEKGQTHSLQLETKKDSLLSKRDRPNAVRNRDRLIHTTNGDRLNCFQTQTWTLCCTGVNRGSLL